MRGHFRGDTVTRQNLGRQLAWTQLLRGGHVECRWYRDGDRMFRQACVFVDALERNVRAWA